MLNLVASSVVAELASWNYLIGAVFDAAHRAVYFVTIYYDKGHCFVPRMYPVGFDVNVEEEMIAGQLGPNYTIDADSVALVVLARDSRRIQE